MNKKVVEILKSGNLERRVSALIAELQLHATIAKQQLSTSVIQKKHINFNTVQPNASSLLKLLNEKSLLEIVEGALLELFIRTLRNDVPLTVEIIVHALIESDFAQEYFNFIISGLIVAKSCNKIERSHVTKTIKSVAVLAQMAVNNSSANASSRMKTRIKCTNILTSIAGLRSPSSEAEDCWIAATVRDALVSKEEFPHICVEITLKFTNDAVEFLFHQLKNAGSTSTLNSNWLLSLLPASLTISLLEACTVAIEELCGTLEEVWSDHDRNVDKCKKRQSLWLVRWEKASKVAVILMGHVLSKVSISTEKNTAAVFAGVKSFADSIVKSVLIVRSKDMSVQLLAGQLVHRKLLVLCLSSLISWSTFHLADAMASDKSTAAPSTSHPPVQGRSQTVGLLHSILSQLSEWRREVQRRREEPDLAEVQYTFIALLAACQDTADLRAYCAAESRVDILNYLDVRKEALVAQALQAALAAIKDSYHISSPSHSHELVSQVR